MSKLSVDSFKYLFIFLIISTFFVDQGSAFPELLDDSKNRITSFQQGLVQRQKLIKYIWTSNKLPNFRPAKTIKNISHPLSSLDQIKSIDYWVIKMGSETTAAESLAHIFHPVLSNGKVMIYHQGHSHTLEENGGQETIKYFTQQGFTVIGLLMPSYGVNTSPVPSGFYHGDLFQKKISSKFSPLRYFLDPVLAVINQIDYLGIYSEINMVGISGGGWSTTVYSALDSRIKHSFSVAGSIPLFLRQPRDVGDEEQFHKPFYSIAGYPELYTLAALEKNRTAWQILNPTDSCCFAITVEPGYVAQVKQVLTGFSDAGCFGFYLLQPFAGHAINQEALERVMLPVLLGP